NTTAVCQRVFDFLGLPPHEVTMPKVYNRGYYREKIDPSIAEMLRAHFRPYDDLLIRLTSQSFGWMGSRATVGARPHCGQTADRAALSRVLPAPAVAASFCAAYDWRFPRRICCVTFVNRRHGARPCFFSPLIFLRQPMRHRRSTSLPGFGLHSA